MPGAGQLRERVRFERRVETEGDGLGNFESVWSPIVTTWAKIAPAKGTETVLASKLQGVQPVEITVRRTNLLGVGPERLTAGDRAVNDRSGEVYNIRAVDNRDMRKKYLVVTAEAGVAT